MGDRWPHNDKGGGDEGTTGRATRASGEKALHSHTSTLNAWRRHTLAKEPEDLREGDGDTAETRPTQTQQGGEPVTTRNGSTHPCQNHGRLSLPLASPHRITERTASCTPRGEQGAWERTALRQQAPQKPSPDKPSHGEASRDSSGKKESPGRPTPRDEARHAQDSPPIGATAKRHRPYQQGPVHLTSAGTATPPPQPGPGGGSQEQAPATSQSRHRLPDGPPSRDQGHHIDRRTAPNEAERHSPTPRLRRMSKINR